MKHSINALQTDFLHTYLHTFLNKFFCNFIDTFFPKYCYFCNEKIAISNNIFPNTILCKNCLLDCQKIYYYNNQKNQHSNEKFCPKCSNLISNKNEKFCPQCQQNFPHFDYVFSVFKYQFPFKKIIHFFKYHKQLSAIPFLAEQFFWHFYQHFDFIKTNFFDQNFSKNEQILFVPMPINKQRLAERGFNQTEILLQFVFKKYKKQLQNLNLNTTLEVNLLLRKEFLNNEKIHLQAKLNANQRKENIKNAFFISEKFKNNLQNCHIFLFDDVVTTGSTANEAAKILKENGAKKVCVFSLARRL